ncbi:MAG TPA: hypothetical protein VIR81_05605 [Myxococcales bacterium]|nr:hypothetical protein [Myxococcales bacterium]
MKRYEGGTEVHGGYFWHVGKWEIATVSGETGTLPGTEKDKYIHTPTPLLFVGAPVMGAAFALFLPFLGFAMPFYAIGKGLFGGKKAEKVDTEHARA